MKMFIRIAALVLGGALQSVSPASAQPATPSLPLTGIMLESGVTLADWVRLVRSREPVPSVGTGAQAAKYVRQHGPYRELLDIVWRAALAKELQREAIGSENARSKLAAVTDARRDLGEWPTLLMASATAKSYLGDVAGATADLRRWMLLAPATDPQRERVTETLLASAQKPEAVTAWLTQTGIGAMPVRLRRPVDPYFRSFPKEVGRAVECIGAASLYDDLAIVKEGRKNHDGVSGSIRTVYRMSEIGLVKLQVTVDGATPRQAGETDETLMTGTGPSWRLLKLGRPDSTMDQRRSSRNIQCSVPLLPAAKGKRVETSWDEDVVTVSGPTDRRETITALLRYSGSLEFLSDAIPAAEVSGRWPALRVNLPADYQGRFFHVRLRGTFEDISPPRPGAQRLPSSQSEHEGLFVEGPNAFVLLRGPAAESYFDPKSVVWTLSRPADE